MCYEERKDIFRCTKLNEPSHLPQTDEALIVEGNSLDQLPSGYSLYLIDKESSLSPDYLAKIYYKPDKCTDGSFVVLDKNEEVRLLSTSDNPDRTLYLTGLCNSNCIMCPYTEQYRLNSSFEPLSLLHRCITLMDPYAEYVCLTGGEPTLLKDGFLDLVKHCKEHFQQTLLHILTNGRTFSYQAFLGAFQQVRPYKTLLGIPIHADNASQHDYISNAIGSFNETIKGLDNLYQAGEHIELRVVTSKLNYLNLPNLAKFIVHRYPYCQHVCLMGLEMMGNAMLHRNEVWVNYDTIWPLIREATEYMISHGVEVELFNYPLCIVDQHLQALYRKSVSPEKIEFLPQCENCGRKNECGGFFRTTKVMPDIHIRPY